MVVIFCMCLLVSLMFSFLNQYLLLLLLNDKYIIVYSTYNHVYTFINTILKVVFIIEDEVLKSLGGWQQADKMASVVKVNCQVCCQA